MSIFFPKAAAPAPLEQVATQGGEPTVVSLQLHHRHGPGYHGHRHHIVRVFVITFLFGHSQSCHEQHHLRFIVVFQFIQWGKSLSLPSLNVNRREVLFDLGSAATNIVNIFTIMKSFEYTFGGEIWRWEGQIKRKFLWLAAWWLGNSLWLLLQVWEWRRRTLKSIQLQIIQSSKKSVKSNWMYFMACVVILMHP